MSGLFLSMTESRLLVEYTSVHGTIRIDDLVSDCQFSSSELTEEHVDLEIITPIHTKASYSRTLFDCSTT